MALRFREDKATQAAARLLRNASGQMSVLKLAKLIYFADRAALLKWGRPITFDWYVAMAHGPVPSFTLDRINFAEEDSYWRRYIAERRGNDVQLKADGPSDQLSRAEERVLDETRR